MTPQKPITPRSFETTRQRGVALVIALAFIVLLTGLMVAFFSRAMAERQVSNSSAALTRASLLAEGATDQIVADLQQEILDGSVTGTSGVYLPRSPLNMLPAFAGLYGSSIPANLLKVSGTAPFYSGSTFSQSGTARGSSIASTGTSLNGRSISLSRWNTALLLPKATGTSASDLTPMTSGSSVFVAPNWVLVSRDGSNPQTWNNNLVISSTNGKSVMGRYAYAIYHEGGLLDLNAAGYPTVTSTTQYPFKPALPYADLKQIPGIGVPDPITPGLTTPLTSAQQNNLIDNLVGWRNYASAAATGSMGTISTTGYSISSGSTFFNTIISNTTGFLTVSGSSNANGQTDRLFTSRQEMIRFFLNGLGNNATSSDKSKLQNALQYLTHFSRDLNQPSLVRLQSTNPSNTFDYDVTAPKVLPANNGGNSAVGADHLVNPSFLAIRVGAGKTFTRNDGSAAIANEPLVKKRFALNRLAWLTYKGPSGDRTNFGDSDLVALMQYGITQEFLKQGTGTNIQKYFGLTWSGSTWMYNVHNGATGSGPTGPILKLVDIANLGVPQEPDFFEMLKATMNVGSLGKALVPGNTAMPADFGATQSEQPYNYNYYGENSVDLQVLQIGANIISQFQTSNYPPRIVFDDGSNQATMPRTIVGVANLPYLNCVMTGVLNVQAPSVGPRGGWNGNTRVYTGGPNTGDAGNSGYQSGDAASLAVSGIGAVMQTPIVWNPHSPASSTGAPGAGPTQFRIVADSTTPDQADNGTHQKFFTYAASMGTTVQSGPQRYSYDPDGSSPGAAWYTDVSGIGNSLAQTITANNTNIEFTINSGTAPLFAEPVALLKPGTMIDSGSNQVTIGVGSNTLMRTTQPVSALFSNGGLPCFAQGSNYTNISAGASYVGLYLGAFPLAWKWSPTAEPLSAAQSGAYVARYTGVAGGSLNACYMTYRMQYKDPMSNQWVTYDTKYGKTFDGAITLRVDTSGNSKSQCMPTGNGQVGSGDPGSGGYWAFPVDPRTSRFGMLWNGTFPNTGNGVNSPFSGLNGRRTFIPLPCYEYMSKSGGWLDTANEITLTIRPDRTTGFYALAGWPFDGASAGSPTGPYRNQYKILNNDGRACGWMAWISTNDPNFGGGGGGTYAGLHAGLLSQNNASMEVVDNKRFVDDIAGGDGRTQAPEYFCDPDGMVRRGMGAFTPVDPYWPTLTSVGLPMARGFSYAYAQNSTQDNTLAPYTSLLQSTHQEQSRPCFLHRPFRNVGELGYVFSDTPWRNLDFSTAESGGSALLDVFCINDTGAPSGLIAGKVNLNTRQAPVLKAILSEAYLDPALMSGTAVTGRIDAATTAGLVASALVTRTGTSPPGLGPLQNLSELVGRRTANTAITHPSVSGATQAITPPSSSAGFFDGKLSYSGFSDGGWLMSGTYNAPKISTPATDVFSAYMNSGAFVTNSNWNGTKDTVSYIQRFREAPIRALAATGQTRVWNLMIDVVAQTGRYPRSANNLNKFIVEGEQRYWVHLAIDRYTGQVIDKQIEPVKE